MDDPGPFDPESFGDMFADKLQELTDEGSELDCSYGDHDFDCLITVGGIEYRVEIYPEALRDLVKGGSSIH